MLNHPVGWFFFGREEECALFGDEERSGHDREEESIGDRVESPQPMTTRQAERDDVESATGVTRSPVEAARGASGDVGSPPIERTRQGPTTAASLRGFVERYGVLLTFAAMIVVFSVLSPDIFPTWRNAETILDQTGTIILISVGLTIVLASGEFDLSFPAAFSLISGIAVVAMTEWGAGPAAGVVVALACGLIVGVTNGLLVATRRASSFIVTLAAGSVYVGIMFGVAGEAPITFGVPSGYGDIADVELLGLSTTILAALGVAAIGALLLRSTVFGRHVQATGSNPEAAAVSGVALSRIRIGAFVVMGVCVAIAAILQTSQATAHYPGAGEGIFLPPFVAAFIGTSVLARGQFNVFGTVIGALFISTLETGLIIQNSPAWLIDVVQGGVLLIAVMVATRTRRHQQ